MPRVGGDALTGESGRRHGLHFPADKSPPVQAFWSLTVYQSQGYLVENPINRDNIGSKDSFETDPDGGITIILSEDNPHGPGNDNTSNWLPIPESEFSLSFRAYWIREPIIAGGDGWQLMPLEELCP